MKYVALMAALLIGGNLNGEETFILTNQPAELETLENQISLGNEYETLFEIIDLEETATPNLLQEESDPVIEEELMMAKNEAPTLEFQLKEETKAELAPLMEIKSALLKEAIPSININFNEVFSGSPIIYSILLGLSILAFFIGLYNHIHFRNLTDVSSKVTQSLRHRLTTNQYEEALSFCLENDNLFCKIIASALSVRKYGLPIMLDSMKAEGKRSTVKYWQKLSLLNDIAIIAPMIGLLGTVLGMFYAFYDINRSLESITALFDGLGISVGTTLAGITVAVLALILHSFARYRLVRRLNSIEHEAQLFATLIDQKGSI